MTKPDAAVLRELVRWNWFFFFNDTATTEIYPLSLHDALPISEHPNRRARPRRLCARLLRYFHPDRKSTRLNSSHGSISYAVFCLTKNTIFTANNERDRIKKTNQDADLTLLTT